LCELVDDDALFNLIKNPVLDSTLPFLLVCRWLDRMAGPALE
jgi:hypothetical protein